MDTIQESVGRMLDGLSSAVRRSQRPSQFVLGRVLAAGDGTLRVSCGGQELDEHDLWVNNSLVPGWRSGLTGELTGTGVHGPCATRVSAGDLTRGEPALAAGDCVVLMTEDQQEYYLLCKVVRL